MISLVFNDGGRAAAGFKGETNDCAIRSIAIATGRPYADIYRELSLYGKSERGRKAGARTGFKMRTIRKYLAAHGWRWVPTMHIGQGCKVHLRADELPNACLIVSVSKHITTMIHGVVHDTHNPMRGGTRCVYGYWIQA